MSYDPRQAGLMGPSITSSEPSDIMQQFMDALSPRTGQPLTVEQQLEALSNTERNVILNLANGIKMSAKLKSMMGDERFSYMDMLNEGMYASQPLHRKQLVEQLMNEIAPLNYTPMGLPKQPTASEIAMKLYEDWDRELQTQSDTVSPAKAYMPEAESVAATPAAASGSGFMQRLTQSESSGNSQAEITIKDGRRFVGSLQFGAARLADFKKHSDKWFTQDEFKADTALQDEVADWHLADIDAAIDGLGDAAEGYELDGLRSVAHLGGTGGMRKFVRSGGGYNPSDELGTSLQDYYDKFSS